jgi:hypothetical protein
MRFNLSVIFICLFYVSQAQVDSSYLRMRILPGKNSIKLDGKIQPTKPLYKFQGEGQHRLTIWALGHEMYDTTFILTRGDTLTLKRSLPILKEYRQYFADKKRYDHQQLLWKGFVRTTSIASFLFAGSRVIVARVNYNKAGELKAQYDVSTDTQEILSLKSEYGERYDKIEACRISGVISLAVGIGTGYLAHKKIKAMKGNKPQYNDPNKVKFDSIAFHPTRMNNQNYATVTITFGL